MPVKEKKIYTTPTLTIHGPVEEITKGCDKKFGQSDGFTFLGDPIVCVS